jgi:hypothetical protein
MTRVHSTIDLQSIDNSKRVEPQETTKNYNNGGRREIHSLYPRSAVPGAMCNSIKFIKRFAKYLVLNRQQLDVYNVNRNLT